MASDRAGRQLATWERLGRTETLTYTPRGGSARSIEGLVERPGNEDTMHAASPALRVTVLSDDTDGIATDEVDTGGDTLSVAERVGEAAATRQITAVESQDEDWLTVEVR